MEAEKGRLLGKVLPADFLHPNQTFRPIRFN